jgi:transcription initiation factor TFIIIB Brf1 subunit/transcription initiation factor TFIIB
MLWLEGCPVCGGDVVLEDERYPALALVCAQCGARVREWSPRRAKRAACAA